MEGGHPGVVPGNQGDEVRSSPGQYRPSREPAVQKAGQGRSSPVVTAAPAGEAMQKENRSFQIGMKDLQPDSVGRVFYPG